MNPSLINKHSLMKGKCVNCQESGLVKIQYLTKKLQERNLRNFKKDMIILAIILLFWHTECSTSFNSNSSKVRRL